MPPIPEGEREPTFNLPRCGWRARLSEPPVRVGGRVIHLALAHPRYTQARRAHSQPRAIRRTAVKLPALVGYRDVAEARR